MRGRALVGAAVTVLALGAWNAHHSRSPSDGTGTLVLRIIPGPPGSSGQKQDTLRVEAPGTWREVAATVDVPVTLHLQPGVYSIRAIDGKACETGVRVYAAATVSIPVLYPTASCQDDSGPPPMTPPGGMSWGRDATPPSMPATPMP